MQGKFNSQSSKRGYSVANKSNFSEYNTMQNSKLQSSQKQKVILDQHYSNNIMMTAMSTLESLEAAQDNVNLKKENKVYGYYDKIRYDDKSFTQLKSQLQTQLGILKASRQVFQMENPNNKYTFSNQFNQNQIIGQIERYKESFRDKEIQRMCTDFSKIVRGDLKSEMAFQQQNYRPKYSEEQANKYKKNVLHGGINAGRIMDLQQDRVKNMKLKNQSDLPIQVNYQAQRSRQPYRQARHTQLYERPYKNK